MSLVDKVNDGIEIPCPECKTKIKLVMGKLYPGNKVTCPGCSATIEFTGDDMRRAQASLEELDRALKRLGK